ncbi:uncharacterized protein LOC141672210 [Apium graveolens]|uniref:uncharacterized protein LOC141672210 n=1 Tax=Apium graveolens TaxID=4045 RepID=UPI003D7B6CAC
MQLICLLLSVSKQLPGLVLMLFAIAYSGDHDLYLSGDLYQNHIVTPAMIIVPRRHGGKGGYKNVKQGKKEEREMVNEYGGYDVKEAPSRSRTQLDAAARRNRAPPKPVDEGLVQNFSKSPLFQNQKEEGTWTILLLHGAKL